MNLNKEVPEYILCAAIWYKELKVEKFGAKNEVETGVVVARWRHGNCVHVTKQLSGLRSVQFAPDGVGESIQGFLTSQNRFVDRKEAGEIALNDEPIFAEFTGFGKIRYDISYPAEHYKPLYDRLKEIGIKAKENFWKGGEI